MFKEKENDFLEKTAAGSPGGLGAAVFLRKRPACKKMGFEV
ncbi:MAG: hypothetical protein Q4D55_03915 [Eubacteriales bacterium]|nr:hypothetical protein [Eubacteriales bacterium]